MIRSATVEDSAEIVGIYNWYVENTIISFEEDSLSVEQMQQRLGQSDSHSPWFVLEEVGELIGFAYGAHWKSRSAYRFSRETSIYLRHDRQGQGRGKKLYAYLIDELRKTPIHTLLAGITLPNEASVALHEKLGFEKCGQFKRVGMKFDKYIDVGYWQLIL